MIRSLACRRIRACAHGAARRVTSALRAGRSCDAVSARGRRASGFRGRGCCGSAAAHTPRTPRAASHGCRALRALCRAHVALSVRGRDGGVPQAVFRPFGAPLAAVRCDRVDRAARRLWPPRVTSLQARAASRAALPAQTVAMSVVSRLCSCRRRCFQSHPTAECLLSLPDAERGASRRRRAARAPCQNVKTRGEEGDFFSARHGHRVSSTREGSPGCGGAASIAAQGALQAAHTRCKLVVCSLQG